MVLRWGWQLEWRLDRLDRAKNYKALLSSTLHCTDNYDEVLRNATMYNKALLNTMKHYQAVRSTN